MSLSHVLLMVLLIAACLPRHLSGSSPEDVVGRLARLEESLHQHEQAEDLRHHQSTEAEDTNHRQLWSAMLCKNEQKRVSEFLKAMADNVPGSCTAIENEKSLAYMNYQPLVVSYLREKEGISSLHSIRDGQLREKLLCPMCLHPSSRVLVLVQPAMETDASEKAALRIGEDLVDYLRNKILPASHRKLEIIGPRFLPCKLRTDEQLRKLYKSYMGSLKTVHEGEPLAASKRVSVWIFRSDC